MSASPPSAAPEAPRPPTDPRRDALLAWLAGRPGERNWLPQTLRPASADASFRRYFRVAEQAAQETWIVMDAPPEHEDVGRFCDIASVLRGAGLSVPRVLAMDAGQGFALLSDLGQTTYLEALLRAREQGASAHCDALMRDALAALVRLQGVDAPWPAYDAARLQTEMDLFANWYVARHLGAELSAAEQLGLRKVMDTLLRNVLAQPVVAVHRDYHSRNLMVLAQPVECGNPGVLDFQDAVRGPITYDLVSLLRDAYVAWPEQQQIDWAVRYWEMARRAGLPVQPDFGVFYRDFEWMGLQRQLKVLGIFARLHHRDGKDQYLADMPRVLEHARAVAARYDEFAPLLRLLDRLLGVRHAHSYTF